MMSADADSTGRPDEDVARYLLFRAGGRRLATPLLGLLEIVQAGRFTPLPDAAPFFLGLANLRGSLACVLDLARRLGWADAPREDRDGGTLLVFPARDGLMAALVDSVEQVALLPIGEDCAEPGFAANVPSEALLGVGRLGDEVFPVVDLGALAGIPLGIGREAYGAA